MLFYFFWSEKTNIGDGVCFLWKRTSNIYVLHSGDKILSELRSPAIVISPQNLNIDSNQNHWILSDTLNSWKAIQPQNPNQDPPHSMDEEPNQAALLKLSKPNDAVSQGKVAEIIGW